MEPRYLKCEFTRLKQNLKQNYYYYYYYYYYY